MSKQASQVAFILDNISNVSSQKQMLNEDTSQKVQPSHTSMTKVDNNLIDHESELYSADTKNGYQGDIDIINHQQKADPYNEIRYEILQSLKKVGISQQIVQHLPQRQTFFDRYPKQHQQSSLSSRSQKSHQTVYIGQTCLHRRKTQTDVISQKQSFVQEEQDSYISRHQEKLSKHKINIVSPDKVHSHVRTYEEDIRRETMLNIVPNQQYVTEINRYDHQQTQLGWLEHCVDANNKFLSIQTKDLINHNKALIMEIQKVQLRTKIIQLQLQTNKLKISLRKTQSAKHINFSLDLKNSKPTFLRIPKKIDLNLRIKSAELQKKLQEMKKQHQLSSKQEQLFEFYEKQFSKKVNYAYIYEQYLIQRAKKSLNTTFAQSLNGINKRSSRSKDHGMTKNKNSVSKSKCFIKHAICLNSSPNKKVPIPTKCMNYHNDSDQSITSLALQVKINELRDSPKKTIQDGSGDVDVFVASPIKAMNKSHEYQINPAFNDYLSQTFNRSSFEQLGNGQTYNKIPLTHNKQINQPSNKKFITLSGPQGNQSHLPLFHTPNRTKKHFYYECQTYLKQLEQDYLFGCQQSKQNQLLKNQNGFRQRQLLKMKATQVKNQILDTQVDMVGKRNQLNRQNQILTKQLKLLNNKLYTEFGDYKQQTTLINNKKSYKNINGIDSKSPKNYELLYRKAEYRLNKIKSAQLLQNIPRPNIYKSPTKNESKRTIQTIDVTNNKLAQKNNASYSQNSDTRTFKKDSIHKQRIGKSPVLRMKKSQLKSNKILNRLKKALSQNYLNLTFKQQPEFSQNLGYGNPQKTIMQQQQPQLSLSRTQMVKMQYYAIGI